MNSDTMPYERFLQEYVIAYRKSGHMGYSDVTIIRMADQAWKAVQEQVKIASAAATR